MMPDILAQVNDSLQRTCLCTRFGAAEVAAGALHLAALLLGASAELPHSSRLGWWDAVGVPLETIEVVSHALCDAVASPAATAAACMPPASACLRIAAELDHIREILIQL